MSEGERFFGFNPRKVRLGLVLGAMACAILAAWALANARTGDERFGVVRGGAAAGLMFAFGYVLFRLRPRAGWGVTVDSVNLVVARPFTAEPVKISMSEVSVVRREGTRRQVLVVFLKNRERLLVPRHLFASLKDFEAVVQTLSERVELPHLDA